MSELTPSEVIAAFFEHYNVKDYAAALAVLETSGARFIDQAPLILYNRACIKSLTHHPAEALADLRMALDKGFWYSGRQLREDADFATLQNLPEFQALVTESNKRYETAKATSKPERIVLMPTTPPPYPVLMALHGNMNSAADSEAFWKPAVAVGWLVALLQSSQVGFTTNVFIWDDEAKSLAEIQQHENELHQAYALDAARLVVGGFSYGGGIATRIGLTHPRPPRGFIAVAPYLPGGLDELTPHIPAARDRGVRAYLVVGDKDDGNYENTLKLAEQFEQHKLPYQIKAYPGVRHHVPTDFGTVLIEALNFITQAAVPSST
jgi:predicted esterase